MPFGGLCCGSGAVGRGLRTPGGSHHGLLAGPLCLGAFLGGLCWGLSGGLCLLWLVVFVLWRDLLAGVTEALDRVCLLF